VNLVKNDKFTIWVPCQLSKVFPDDKYPDCAENRVHISAARNEYEAFQVAIKAETDLREVRTKVGRLKHTGGYAITQENLKWNFVGLVPVKAIAALERKTWVPEQELVRTKPGLFPDPLLEDETASIPKGETRSIWVTVRIPEDAPSGNYFGKVLVMADGEKATVNVSLKVWNFTLPKESHMWLTHFMWVESGCQAYGIQPWSEDCWKLIENYAEDMAAHRQNVILTPSFSLIKIYCDDAGNLSFDFTDFDRWVTLFKSKGIPLIEGFYLARAKIGDKSEKFPFRRKSDGALISNESYDTFGEEFEKYFGAYLKALEKHLEEKGWLKDFVIHLSDEPKPQGVAAYRRLGEVAKKYAPRIRRVDAIVLKDEIAGYIDIWVPLLSEYFTEYYKERQKMGEEVWWYTACMPRGNKYPNLFIDYPLIKVRIIHWLNFTYGITGWLRWGYNYYFAPGGKEFLDPWQENSGKGTWPAGDPFFVYPGKNLKPLSSIRWEEVREGMEDYEYLWLLRKKIDEKKGSAEAAEAEKVMQQVLSELASSLTDYARDPVVLLIAREKIAEQLERFSK